MFCGLKKDRKMFSKKDPVCQAKVRKNTEHKFQFEGKMYYFDSVSCLATFKNEPQRFIRKKSEGILSMIAKNSKDVPKSCH